MAAPTVPGGKYKGLTLAELNAIDRDSLSKGQKTAQSKALNALDKLIKAKEHGAYTA